MTVRLSKLRYRAWHRGFREADLVLGPFADAHVGGLTDIELDAFEALLDEPDQDLWAWIVGQAAAPAAHDGPVLARIRAFRFEAHRALASKGA